MRFSCEPARTGQRLSTEQKKKLRELVSTIDSVTKENDVKRIANLVGCSISTVKRSYDTFLAEATGSSATGSASPALLFAGASAPTVRVCAGVGSGGAGGCPPPHLWPPRTSLPPSPVIRPQRAPPIPSGMLRCVLVLRTTLRAVHAPENMPLTRSGRLQQAYGAVWSSAACPSSSVGVFGGGPSPSPASALVRNPSPSADSRIP